ncbi:MAG: hypothetical protein M5E90_04775 [Asgard group archaeon]|nr:hypothetical protein [Asgard group archaeon]
MDLGLSTNLNKPKQAEIEQPVVLDISKKYEIVSPVKDEDKKILEIQLNGSPRQRSIALDNIVERSREKNSIIAGLRTQVEDLQAKLKQLSLSPPKRINKRIKPRNGGGLVFEDDVKKRLKMKRFKFLKEMNRKKEKLKNQ